MNVASLGELVVDNREFGRFGLSEPCLLLRDGRPFRTTTRNISKGGLCIVSGQLGRTCLGADFSVFLREFEPINATMRWQNEHTYGLAFLDSVKDHPEIYALIEALRAAPPGCNISRSR